MPASALVVVPTYNEAGNIREIVTEILSKSPSLEVLVVDDDSPDGTGRMAEEMAAREPRLHVLHRPGKEGLGKAYVAGFRWALERGYPLVIQMDADFSHDPKDVPRLIEAAGEADLVVGSRNVEGGGTINWGVGRQLISKGGSLYARTILGTAVRDMTSGFKCWRRELLESIDLEKVTTTGYAFQVEMTHRASRLGRRIVELPIVFVDRRVGQSKMSRAIFVEALVKVWALRFGR